MNDTGLIASLTSLAPHWIWLIAACVLAVMEMLAPGFFLIWLALAAAITGMIAYLLPDWSFAAHALVFAVLAIVSVYAGRRWFALKPIESTDPHLNNKSARMLGEVVVVVEALSAGQGRVKSGDGFWPAKGVDAAVDEKVRVTGVEGATLLVEKL